MYNNRISSSILTISVYCSSCPLTIIRSYTKDRLVNEAHRPEGFPELSTLPTKPVRGILAVICLSLPRLCVFYFPVYPYEAINVVSICFLTKKDYQICTRNGGILPEGRYINHRPSDKQRFLY